MVCCSCCGAHVTINVGADAALSDAGDAIDVAADIAADIAAVDVAVDDVAVDVALSVDLLLLRSMLLFWSICFHHQYRNLNILEPGHQMAIFILVLEQTCCIFAVTMVMAAVDYGPP